MRITLTTAALCVLGVSTAAQYPGEPPNKVNGPTTVTGLFNEIRTGMINAGIGIQDVQQYEIRPWTGSTPPPRPGLFYLAFTYSNGAYTGLWDQNAPAGSQFTALPDFQSLNQAGLFALSVSRDHLLCVADRGLNLYAGYSVRSSVTQPWSQWESLRRGFGYVDSKTDQMNGTDQYFWVAQQSIYATPIDRSAFGNPNLNPCTGANTLVISKPLASSGLHSHNTMVDGNNEVRAFILSSNDAGTGDADPFFATTTSDIDAIKIIHDSADWHATPGSLGGTTWWAHNPNYTDPDQIDLFCINGQRVPASGGIMTLRTFVPFDSLSYNQWTTIVFVGPPAPASFNFGIPNVYGNWGLGAGFGTLPPKLANTWEGGVDHSYQMPNLPPGLFFWVQAVGVDPNGDAYLSNTATVEFR